MRAFTLVEFIISMAIMLVLVAGIYGVLNVGQISWRDDMGLLDLQQWCRVAMDGMLKEIRQARISDVSILDAGTRLQFVVPTDITTDPITYSDTIEYELINSRLIREHPPGENKVLSNDISNIGFCFLHTNGTCDSDPTGADILQISLDSAKSVMQRQLSFSLTEQARLRNE